MSTYVPIQAITLGSNATDISFTGIPQTFTDLVVVCSVRSTRASADDTLLMQVNSDTTSLYSGTWMVGSGTAATSSRNSSQTAITAAVNIEAANATASTFTPVLINVQNYSNTTTNKTVLMRHSAPTREVGASVGLWRSTSAISSIKIYASIGSLASGSTFTLYGIGSGAPKAFGGNEVRTDGTYWYHIFRSSGRFEPVQTLSCDVLVVAGGGGGASGDIGGGGGAGGFRTSTAFSTSANSAIAVTVGGGGAINAKGADSIFSTITSTGGGFGGPRASSLAASAGGSGGSGGGGGGSLSAGTVSGGSGNTPSTSPSQGNNGGTGFGAGDASAKGGGGGGAGAVGGNGTTVAGAGGNGSSSSLSGSSVTYAGGGGGSAYGGGGAGGTGGGGTGSNAGTGGTAGTANTGGGGGGNNAGGSGIVIVRYAV